MELSEKELLLKDLSARLSYNVRVHVKLYGDYSDGISEHDFVLNEIDTRYPSNCYWIGGEQLRGCSEFGSGTTDFAVDIDDEDQELKPYLRPMSSMTKEERAELGDIIKTCGLSPYREITESGEDNLLCCTVKQAFLMLNYLYSKHFDINHLIDSGLAIEAPEGMYDIKS